MKQNEKNIETVKSYVKEVIKKIEITQKFPDLIKSYITDDQIRLIVCERRYGGVIELDLILREGKKNWSIEELLINSVTTKKEKLASYLLTEIIKIAFKKYPAPIYVSSNKCGVFLEHQKDFYLKNNFVKKGSYFVYG